MTPAAMLDACKKRLGLPSDYALAKACGMSRGAITQIRQGVRPVSPYLAFWTAITLEVDPAELWAEVEAQQEKHAARAEFWRSFLSRAQKVVAVLFTLAFVLSAGLGNDPAGNGGGVRRRLKFA